MVTPREYQAMAKRGGQPQSTRWVNVIKTVIPAGRSRLVPQQQPTAVFVALPKKTSRLLKGRLMTTLVLPPKKHAAAFRKASAQVMPNGPAKKYPGAITRIRIAHANPFELEIFDVNNFVKRYGNRFRTKNRRIDLKKTRFVRLFDVQSLYLTAPANDAQRLEKTEIADKRGVPRNLDDALPIELATRYQNARRAGFDKLLDWLYEKKLGLLIDKERTWHLFHDDKGNSKTVFESELRDLAKEKGLTIIEQGSNLFVLPGWLGHAAIQLPNTEPQKQN